MFLFDFLDSLRGPPFLVAGFFESTVTSEHEKPPDRIVADNQSIPLKKKWSTLVVGG